MVSARRFVVVERTHPAQLGDALPRVRSDVERAMGIAHPNVVATLGMACRPREIAVATEYVPGISLTELLGRALAPAVASGLLGDALRGLGAAPASLSRRCFSPRRVIIGHDGRARLTAVELASQSASAIAFDLPYVSPEQLERRATDERRDVYAASVVLWETLTGRRLFRGASLEETRQRILRQVVLAPSVFSPDVPPELDAIVMRGLSRAPELRFPTASAMASALSRLHMECNDRTSRE